MNADVPPVLWRPSAEAMAGSAFARFAEANRLEPDYLDVHAWSIANLNRFWAALAEFTDVHWITPPTSFLADASMPGAKWCPGGTLSYPAHIFRDRAAHDVAIHHDSEARGYREWTWGELRDETARIAGGLRRLGVDRGDRVCAYLPNVAETVAAFLATASLGAVWSCAAPEFGAEAVIARFAQIEPRVLLTADGYRYRGRDISRDEQGARIAECIGVRAVRFGYLDGSGWEAGFLSDSDTKDAPELTFEAVPFDHPLWILYSSGTTGTPKAIVHGHGGVLLEQLKTAVVQQGLTAADRLMWFTTTGWVMWNYLVSGLLAGSRIVLFDGDPSGEVLWDLAERAGVTVLGASAGYFLACLKDGLRPADERNLSALRAIGSTGAPLDPRCFDWVYEVFPARTWLFSISGGTDVVSAFLGATPEFPVYRGELAPAALGVDLASYSPDGERLVEQVGEMVIAQPMPSMPLYFWNDAGDVRLRDSYFTQFPGVWTHGDWLRITDRGTGVIYGRSDATLNRGGVRFGTSELYDVVLALPEVSDALAVDIPVNGDNGRLLLFVTTTVALDEELAGRIRAVIRTELSPRNVPDDIVAVTAIPKTISGKRIEIPIKRILTGASADGVLDLSSLADPDALVDFERFAQSLTDKSRHW